jgi:hypothetical protein
MEVASTAADLQLQVERKIKAMGCQMFQTGRGFMVTGARGNLAAGCKPLMTLDEIATWMERPRGVQGR